MIILVLLGINERNLYSPYIFYNLVAVLHAGALLWSFYLLERPLSRVRLEDFCSECL